MHELCDPLVIKHGTPATTPQGDIVYVCMTQPREYTTSDGKTSYERDTYISVTSCPTEPIN